ncbi:sensor histidine kinase [Pseudoxanthomonas sp.]|uniref:sensor histidine kinase n=1 Tax=Pseudoxanthomonas sp. TaxID=1871049 RepID=UPI0026276C2D|nr:sensor histidine kinase [Pseudoxanthomonas sp.]WDS34728.1 MAG: ATP-binding protein [Pseudoxanthomonas sp.]
MNKAMGSLRGLLSRRLWMLLPLLLAGAVASFLLASYFADKVFDGWLVDSATALGHEAVESQRSGGPWLPPKAVEMVKWDSVDQLYVQLRPSPAARALGDPIPAADDLSDSGQSVYDTRYDGRRIRVAQVRLYGLDGTTFTEIRVGETLRKRRLLRYHLLLASIPLQLGVIGLAALLLASATSAVASAARQAARRLAGYNETQLRQSPERLHGPAELQPAFDAMNALIGRLTNAQQAQQRFISNAAHQLRTPLAVLQVQIESALRERDPTGQREAVTHALNGLTRLRRLVEQLLTLNRSANAAESQLSFVHLDLALLAREEVEYHADRAIQLGVDLGYDGPEAPVEALGEPQLLREVLANLIDNALRYGRAGGLVTVGVTESPPQLFVEDDGAGIAEADRARVVERFYRANHEGDGSGLGLAIVAEIAALHRAGMKVEASSSGGARFVISFG